MDIKKVTVIGAGKMGRQIALSAAIKGYEVFVQDAYEAGLADAKKWEEEYLIGRIQKGRMTEEQVKEIRSRFFLTGDLSEACRDADIVIEAIFEQQETKREVLHRVSELVSEDAIIATNSSVMVSSLFRNDVKNPERLLNLHFYNPALVMKFVEVVQGPHTAEKYARIAYDFACSLGKVPVWLRKEIGGFLGNYVLGAFVGRTRQLVEDGYITYQEGDIIQEQGMGRKMGCFRVNDLSGVDFVCQVIENQFAKTGKKGPMFDMFHELRDQGRLGRKTGHGFYDYEEPYTVREFRDRGGAESIPVTEVLVIGGHRGRELAEEINAGGVKAEFVSEEEWRGKAEKAQFLLGNIDGDMETQKKFYKELSERNQDAIIAINNYDFVSSEIISGVKNPSRVLSMHFCALFDKLLVEIVQGPHTDPKIAGSCYDLSLKLGKKPVWEQREHLKFGYCSKDIMDGIGTAGKYLVENGYCAEEDVDISLIHGNGFREGYYELLKKEF